MKKNKRKAAKPNVAEPNAGYPLWLLKNLIAAGIAGFLIFKCINTQPAYQWVYGSLLKGNMAFIKANPKLSLDEKFRQKLGSVYPYFQYIKQQTPDTAVILYPGAEDFFPEDKKSPFTGEPFNKIYALRFLYPRKLVLPSEMQTSKYAKEITHVAIVNGRGFERVNYTVRNRFEHGILPVNP